MTDLVDDADDASSGSAVRTLRLARLAETAAQRLPSMSLEQQVGVLRLLRIQVTLLDGSATPDLRIEGVVPGGADLFGEAETMGDLAGVGRRAMVVSHPSACRSRRSEAYGVGTAWLPVALLCCCG